MAIKNKNHSRLIFRLSRFDHAFSWLLLFILVLPCSDAEAGTVSGRPPPPPPPDPYSSYGSKFNPSMAIIMVVLVSAFFFMGFFSVYIRQCAERRFVRNFDPAGIGGGGRRSRRAARGLDAAVIEAFPTFLYSTVKGLTIGKGTLECAVCLNEFEDNETLRFIPKCSHVFHPDCIDAWLASHTTCPVCRANLVPRPGEIISCATIQIFDTDSDSGEPDHRSDNDGETQNQGLTPVADDHREVESPDVNLVDQSLWTNQNRPPRSRSTGWRLTGLFPRSHSTGHSLIQPGENCDRFTLRFPEEVRSQLMNTPLNRTKSCVAFPRVRSSRRGYRSRSGGSGRARNYFHYERFDRDVRSDRWAFTMTSPFFSRTGSLRSPKVMGGEEGEATPPKTAFKSIKSPIERLFLGKDTDGERSSDKLRPDSQV